jgi:purine-binding chemotaxis protein CheW
MGGANQLVVFTLDGRQYGLGLSCVERIVRAVAVTHLPEAPDAVHGVINVEGRVIPVVDSRKRLGLPEREIEPEDHFIIVTLNGRSFALAVDAVKPVIEVPHDRLAASDTIIPGKGYVRGVAKLEQGMVMILSPEKTLSFEENREISSAIEGMLEE